MKYTIAIPTYNNEKTIKKAILSALNQSFDNEYEVLVVNNDSSDGTSEILESLLHEYDFKVVTNTETVSLFDNHNVCLSEASGDYILFIHSDDYLYDDALLKLDQGLIRYCYPKRLVCWGRSYFRDFSSAFKEVGQLNTIVSGVAAQELFQYGGLTPSGTCYSRVSFLESGGFLPMVNRITPSDMSSMIRFSLEGAEFLMLDRILFKREAASTAINIPEREVIESIDDALKELSYVVGRDKMYSLYQNIKHFKKINLRYYSVLHKYSGRRTKMKFFTIYLLKSPLQIRHLINRNSTLFQAISLK